jgi:hypothetical protein
VPSSPTYTERGAGQRARFERGARLLEPLIACMQRRQTLDSPSPNRTCLHVCVCVWAAHPQIVRARTCTPRAPPRSPSPRCAHQAVVYKGCMYVFGGEFSSPNQERFMHFRWGRAARSCGAAAAQGSPQGARQSRPAQSPCPFPPFALQNQRPGRARPLGSPSPPPPPPKKQRDLWRLDLSTHEWDSLPTRGGPSARSGHRMALHKNKAILFGGFYDTGSEVKWVD